MSRLSEMEVRVKRLRKAKTLRKIVPPLLAAEPRMWSPWLELVPWVGVISGILAWICDRPTARLGLSVTTALLFLLAWWLRSESERLRERVLARGLSLRTGLIMANPRWYEESNDQPWPGSVVLTFHEPLEADSSRLQALAEGLFQLRDQDRSRMSPGLAAVAWSLSHGINCERIAVPEEFCGAPDTWVCSTMLPADSLDEDGFIWMLALAGETSPSAALTLPGAVLAGGNSR